MNLSIHDIKEIKFDKLVKLRSDVGHIFYSRHLTIETNKGEILDIVLFNDNNPDVLKVAK